jgi:hypothetical protein
MKELDKALQINPNYSSALFNKGKVFYFMKDFNAGDDYLDRAQLADQSLSQHVNQLKKLKILSK